MSRDIFVQDIPADVRGVQDIPGDWQPGALPFAREAVVSVMSDLAPSADFSDPAKSAG